MKTMKLTALFFAFCFLFASCGDDEDIIVPFTIDEITFENFPRMDCSTSAGPLQTIIACKLLNFKYNWIQNLHSDGSYTVYVDEDAQTIADIYDKQMLQSTGTNGAYTNLINGEADLIFVARSASEDELAAARAKGISFVEKAIALDAFVFMVNGKNPVKELTTKQIQDIYTGETTNWKSLGGKDATISPYVRNRNSGSQELMESLVMKDIEMPEWPEFQLSSMMHPFTTLDGNENGIAYTVNYYKEMMVRSKTTPSLAVDGVLPTAKNIREKKYPYWTEVYAVIRSNSDADSPERAIFDALTSENAQKVVEESGYVRL